MPICSPRVDCQVTPQILLKPQAPRVFISYSYDGPTHEQWVADLGAKLLANGIDVMLDQWDCPIAADIPMFMERSVASADRVIVVCTDNYIDKANAGTGGVGYERMIITAELVRDLGTTKFIPLVRNVSYAQKLPICLGARKYVDFSNESDEQREFMKLIATIHNVAAEKPPLGKNPFEKSAAQPSSLSPNSPGEPRRGHGETLRELSICVRDGERIDLLDVIGAAMPRLDEASGLRDMRPGVLRTGLRRFSATRSGPIIAIETHPALIATERPRDFSSAVQVNIAATHGRTRRYEYRPSGLVSDRLTVLLTDSQMPVLSFREQALDPMTLSIRFIPS